MEERRQQRFLSEVCALSKKLEQYGESGELTVTLQCGGNELKISAHLSPTVDAQER